MLHLWVAGANRGARHVDGGEDAAGVGRTADRPQGVWDGDDRNNLNCTLREVNEWGVFVEIAEAELPAFYPWTAVLRISTTKEQGRPTE